MPTESVQKVASLMRIDEPQFLTLTKNPANRAGFKVLRSDPHPDTLDQAPRMARIRTKRADHPGLLAIRLPEDVTSDNVDGFVDKFKLGGDYKVTEVEGRVLLVRNGADVGHLPDAIAVPFDDCTAYLSHSNVAMRSVNSGKTGVTLMQVTFSSGFGDAQEVQQWMDDHGIGAGSSCEAEVQEDGSTIVSRHDMPKDDKIPVNLVKIEEGVCGLVCPTEGVDVPTQVYRSIIETTYGNWGWGSLDFVQAVADQQFSGMARDAVSLLNDVLWEILFYSDLPLDDRKLLVQNAANSFSAYLIGMIDALPQEAVRAAEKDATNTPGANDMSKKIEDKEDLKRSAKGTAAADAAVGAQDADAADTASDESTKFVTRADFDKLTDSVAQLVAKLDGKGDEGEDTGDTKDEDTAAVKRSDEASADDGDTATALVTVAAAVESIARSLKDLDGKVESLSEGTTVTRGTDDDPEQEDAASDQPKSVFRGMFGAGIRDPRDRSVA